MTSKDFIEILLGIILLIIILSIADIYFNKITIKENCIFIPAVSKNGGIITEFCLKSMKGTGKVFIEIPNVFSDEYQLSFVIAKQAVCKIDNRCNNYDYMFYTKEHFSGEGFSGTAGLATLILQSLYKSTRSHNISITGFILPNGLILPVGGIQEKFEASKSKNLTLLAPSNYSKEIIQIYTLLDIKDILFDKYQNYSFEIPEKYELVLRNISLDICDGIDDKNIIELIEKKSFYTAASLCFIKKSEENSTKNISLNNLESDILNLENIVNSYNCKTYTCEEIKFQVLTRINLSKEETDINKKYWRFYTAKGWYLILKELEDVKRENTCKKIEEDYKILITMYDKEFSKNISCFEKREVLSKIYYNLLLSYNLDINAFLERVEKYLFYLYTKYGFSITSYNYFVYGKDLINMGKISDGVLYILYAVNYAI